MLMRTIALLVLLSLTGWASVVLAEDGYDLWLRYRPLPAEWVAAYRPKVTELIPGAHSPTLDLTRAELSRGLGGLLLQYSINEKS